MDNKTVKKQIEVLVVPNSRKAEVIKINDTSYKVKVDVPPVEGKANLRLVSILADYFKVHKSSITIVKGNLSKRKLVEIN